MSDMVSILYIIMLKIQKLNMLNLKFVFLTHNHKDNTQ